MATMRITSTHGRPLPQAKRHDQRRPRPRWARALPVGALAVVGLCLLCAARAAVQPDAPRDTSAVAVHQAPRKTSARPARTAAKQAPMLKPPAAWAAPAAGSG